MLVLVAIMMIGFMMAVAFSVDIAQMHLTKTELRTATDAASKAAAATLAETMNRNQAIKRGRQIAAANSVNSEPLRLSRNDFKFGNASPNKKGKFEFRQGLRPYNTVHVTGRRTEQARSGAVPLFFGGLTGVEIFETESTAAATYIERDVVLVVDRSGSMYGSKFRDLISAITTFTDTLEETPVEEYVGLASYAEYGSTDVPLTPNLYRVSQGVRSLRLGGWTSVSRGMEAGNQIMQGGRNAKFVERTMIVMTDGRHNRGPSPELTAQQLHENGITIHTITFGRDADRSRMAEVARIGGGRHYHADNGVQLKEIYREIALTLSTIMTQ
jgi:Mg-chelatase subunit ChlD